MYTKTAVVGMLIMLCLTVGVVQAQPPQEIITKDTVRACELAGLRITDNSTLKEVRDALEIQFSGILSFPPNPARTLLRRIEVVRSPGCVVTEWEFHFVGDPRAPVFPFEVIPTGLGDAQHNLVQYNAGCGCQP